MKVTIKEIAHQCGVSEGSVDRALNGRDGIKEETRRRILEVARELNYVPNRVAQSLATGKTKTIGIVCFDLTNNFFSMLVDVIENEANSQGYFIELILTHRDISKEKDGIRHMAQRGVDGIILFSVGKGEEYVRFLKSFNIPIVTIYNKISTDFAHIGIDDYSAMADAVGYAVRKEYKQIVLLTPSIRAQEDRGANVYTLKRRMEGYINGIKTYCPCASPIIFEGADFETTLLNIDFSIKTAILCVCDTYALSLMTALEKTGRRIPEDVGVMGFDNIALLEFIRPRLTTIEYHIEKMGQKSFELIYDIINAREIPCETIFAYALVEGETM